MPFRYIVYGLLLTAASALSTAGATVFEDDFSNGTVADSTSAVGFWSLATASAAGDANAIVESGGTLTLTAGSNDGGDDNSGSGVRIHSSLSSDFNFFAQTRTYALRGITFDDHGTGIANDKEQLRFCLLSSSVNSWGADDAVVVRIRPDGTIRLGMKDNSPNSNSDGDLIDSFTGLGTYGAYGFDLSLRRIDANTVEYGLLVYTNATPVPAGVKVGTMALAQADWGTAGDSHVCLWAQESVVTGGNQYFDATVTNLCIQSTPNLLFNHGFEGGTSGWSTLGAGVSISTVATPAYSGSYACLISSRGTTWNSIRRDIDTVMSPGNTYTVSLWARLGSGPDDSARLRIKVVDSAGDHYTDLDTKTLTVGAWTRLQGRYTYSYTGTLTEAFLYINDIAIGIEILVDEASITLTKFPTTFSFK